MKNFLIIIACFFTLFLWACQEKTKSSQQDVDAIANYIEAARIRHGISTEYLTPTINKDELAETLEKEGAEEVRKKIDLMMPRIKREQERAQKDEEREKFFREIVKPELDKAKTKEQYIEVAKKYPDFVEMPD